MQHSLPSTSIRFGLAPAQLVLFCLATGCAEPAGDSPLGQSSFEVDTSARIEALIAEMTLDEKTSMLHGVSYTDIAGVPRLAVPPFRMTDGPLGVARSANRSTAFPSGTGIASTFNPNLVEQAGAVIGQETAKNGFGMLLGPAINIIRTPIGGRSFEYMTEDPFLVSQLVAGYVRGVQSQKVAACVKHFAANSVELDRGAYSAEVDERTMREIYLPGFRAAVQAGALTLMSAYNRVNGTYAGENQWILNDLAKTEWGLRGFVVSDWGGTHSTVAAAQAGLDVEMPGDTQFFAAPLANAVTQGLVSQAVLDDKVRRVLRVVEFTGGLESPAAVTVDQTANAAIARRVAEEGIVLLKNAAGALPLDPALLATVAVIGPNATTLNASGGGSSSVPALYEITPLEGLKTRLGTGVQIISAGDKTSVAAGDFSAATLAAKTADATILFVGTDKSIDHEGADRPDLHLLPGHDDLVRTVLAANPKSIVVLVNGSALEMPWVGSAQTIVEAWYGGMEAGTAIARVLVGDVNPSGKLPITFPKTLMDSPAHANGNYPVKDHVLRYDEGILVGYRYFDTKGIEPLFPFGHGLSYTTFKYDDVRIDAASGGGITLSFSVTNTGSREGLEVAQVYVHPTQSGELRPEKELKGFQKIKLEPGEKQQVTVALSRESFGYFSSTAKTWTVEPAVFEILVGSSSKDIRLRAAFDLRIGVEVEAGAAIDASVDAPVRPPADGGPIAVPPSPGVYTAAGGCAVVTGCAGSGAGLWIAMMAATAGVIRRRCRRSEPTGSASRS
jgi:beta-glucosidase